MLSRSVRDIGLPEIAHRLGLDRLEAATIVKHLRTLATAKGFPLPRTTRFWRGELVCGPKLIVAGAIWNRYEVDKWFEDRDPPATRAARQRQRQEALREEMASRAVAAATPRRIAASA
ncbi:hypothetical protein AI27_05620 [Sphingomonas sp. BHC-A]|nr:hypothetical protein AI27_05620 [Sphingomonas sp. BHC-A]